MVYFFSLNGNIGFNEWSQQIIRRISDSYDITGRERMIYSKNEGHY